jgi:uncharacterized membrane protein YgdD (TMEM256/DUF423 family)
VLAGTAVGIGAFGAHGLKTLLAANGYAETFETAVRYHFYHALGMMLLALWQQQQPQRVLLSWAQRFMLAGVLIFSGTLYVLSLTGIKWLGAITPIGGLAFIFAWAIAATEGFRPHQP